MLSSAAATVITEPVPFSLADVAPSRSVDPCVVTVLAMLVPIVLLAAVVTVVIAVVGLVVALTVVEDINVVGDVVLSIVVFFVGRGLVDVSKWDVVM